MPSRKRRRRVRVLSSTKSYLPDYVLASANAWGRAGWAKWYSEVENNESLRILNAVLRDRIEVLLPEFLALVNAVLYEREPVAFARAWRVKQVVDDFLKGSGEPEAA
jgi:hypothetical protein